MRGFRLKKELSKKTMRFLTLRSVFLSFFVFPVQSVGSLIS